MKSIFNKVNIVLLAVFAFTMSACLDGDEVDFGKGPIIVQFSNKTISSNFLQDGTGVVYAYNVPIEYQGGNGDPISEDVTISITVDPSSTATEGVEFDLGVTEFTIPAGEKFANAVVQVKSANLDSSNPKTLVLSITTSSQTVSDKNQTAIVLQAICPSSLEGEYAYTNGNQKDATVTVTGSGTYSVSVDNAFGGNYPIDISDVCGNLTITGGYLAANFGIPVSGNGSVDEATGIITLIYTVDGYFSNRPMYLEPK